MRIKKKNAAALSPIRNPKSAFRNRNVFRIIALIVGLAIAAWGGVIIYRALFLEPSATAVINTGTGAVREYPNLLRLASGLIMLICGGCAAFFAARRKPM